MSSLAQSGVGPHFWTAERATRLLVVLNLPVLIICAVVTSVSGPEQVDPLLPILGAVVIGVLQLRHSLAEARGTRPKYGALTFLVLALAVYLPLPWFGWSWAGMQVYVIVSAPMALPRRFGLVLSTLSLLSLPLQGDGWTTLQHDEFGLFLYQATRGALTYAIAAGALYAVTRLLRLVEQLQAARVGLAQLAIGRERLRVSRDLHDLLGQSLSAVALKGELAARLLLADPDTARAEIESLTEVARGALRGVREVTSDQHRVSLRSEVDSARALLSAAGIEAMIEVDLPELSAGLEDVLGWAVREGATNVLRHSTADTCEIRAARRAGLVYLEMLNNGAEGPVGAGTGLAGLTARARALSGSVLAEAVRGGRFRLLVEVPEEVR
ncbi:sensor histidine kinase [Amycolatopsis nigrescens]|uniref:sensor histidine kinase n=1 Tax=Amycolatopsis nigrescens TaxID=381445 RepID=UPI00035EFE9E|nr:histidine kinase [Amycolatopsis nigrescens]